MKYIIVFLLTSISISCSNKEEISVTIKTVDFYTKEPRTRDTIEVRMQKPGLLKMKNIKIGKCRYTDSLGEVKIKLFKNERYRFNSCGLNPMFESKTFKEGELKNNSIVIIEVKPENNIKF